MRVGVTFEGSQLRFEVRDDGSGIDPGRECRGRGLHNMRVRAQRMGGGLEVDNCEPRGTRIALRLPRRLA